MEKGKIGKGSAAGQAMECSDMANSTWDRVMDESWRLSHLVQSGRRVSKEQLLEVEQEVNGPHGFINK